MRCIDSGSILLCIDGKASLSSTSLAGKTLTIQTGTVIFISANEQATLSITSQNGVFMFRAYCQLWDQRWLFYCYIYWTCSFLARYNLNLTSHSRVEQFAWWIYTYHLFIYVVVSVLGICGLIRIIAQRWQALGGLYVPVCEWQLWYNASIGTA